MLNILGKWVSLTLYIRHQNHKDVSMALGSRERLSVPAWRRSPTGPVTNNVQLCKVISFYVIDRTYWMNLFNIIGTVTVVLVADGYVCSVRNFTMWQINTFMSVWWIWLILQSDSFGNDWLHFTAAKSGHFDQCFTYCRYVIKIFSMCILYTLYATKWNGPLFMCHPVEWPLIA